MAEPIGTERVLYQDEVGNTVGDVYQLGSQTLRPGVEYTTRAGHRYSFVKVSYGPNGGGDAPMLHGYVVGDDSPQRLQPSLPAQVKTIHRTKEMGDTHVPDGVAEAAQAADDEAADNTRYHAAYNHARSEALATLKERHRAEYSRLLADARRKHNAYRSNDERFNHDRT